MKNYLTLILMFLAAVANAQRLKTEDFNYSLGQLTDANGGANVSGGNWKTNSGTGKYIQVVEGNLTYPSYITNPVNNAHILLDSTKGSAEDVYTNFDSVESNTVYCSFLINVNLIVNVIAHDSAVADYFVALLASNSTTAYTARLFIRQGSVANTYNLGLASQSYKNTPIVWINTDYPINTTQLVTLGYTFVDGDNNDITKLWVNPPVSATEPTPNASSVYTGGEPTNIGRFALRQNNDQSIKGGTPKCQVDAIKISTDWKDGTLPLSLTSVSVLNNNGYATLKWNTCNEVNIDHFEIQKSSDARSFTTVGTMQAKNNLNCNNSYSYSDTKQLSGTSYFRIKVVNKESTYQYSGVVSVNGSVTDKIKVFPNPVTNNLVLDHPKAIAGAVLQIVSLNGNVIASYTVQTDAVQTSVSVSNLAKGNYIAVFKNGKDAQSITITKQ